MSIKEEFKTVWRILSNVLVVVLLVFLILMYFNNKEIGKLNKDLKTRNNNQADLIIKMTILTEAYNELIPVHEALIREYQDYRDNKEQRVAIDPIENLFDADEIPELLKSIPTGTPFRGSFSVTSPFGESVGFHGSLRKDHKGTDMTPDDGNWIVTPIGDGVVEEFGENRIFGKYVLIKHSERVYSFYAHLDKIYYAGTTGAVVTADTAIGIMGNTGLSDNSHLHYELHIWTGKDMERINGLPFMNRCNNE